MRAIVTARHRGRHLDVSRDPEIHRAALELLAECGYDRLTIDAVAARAHAGKATIYRRWRSKAELVVDALVALADPPAEAPDTGSLRDDILALLSDTHRLPDDQWVAQMAGLVPAMRRDPALKTAFDQEFVAARECVVRRVFERAQERGEVAADADLDILVAIVPSLVMFRLLLMRGEIDPDYARRIVDHVVVPAATHR